MADNERNISITLDCDTSNAQADIKRFGDIAQKALQSSDTKVQKMGVSLQNTVNKMSKLNAQMTELANKQVRTQEYEALDTRIKQLNSDLKLAYNSLSEFEKTSLHTEEWDYLSQKIQDIKTALEDERQTLGSLSANGAAGSAEWNESINRIVAYEDELKETEALQQKLTDAGLKYASSSNFTEKMEQVRQLETELDKANTAQQELVASGNAYTTGADTQQYRDLANQASLMRQQAGYMANSMGQAASSANKMKSNLRGSTSVIESIKTKVGSLIGKLGQLGKQSVSTGNTHNTSFKKMLTTVLKYGFGIRSIFLLYKKVRTTISTGLSEMSKQFSDVADDVYTLKNSWSGFKSSLVSAFQPILSYVVPALTTLINYLTSAMNAIANFFALLTGQSYYYKAVKGNESVADSIGGTGSAAEDANEELAEYDDLIVIDQDSNSGGSGGGSGSSSDAWNWEKTNVEASSLADKLSNIWDVFKKAWENKGQAVIDAATTAFNNVKSLLSTIATTIYDVFVSGTGQTWVESVLTLFTSILTTIGLIASAWETAWNKDNNGYKFVESIFNMFTSINDMISTIQDSWNKAWTSDDTGVNIISNVLSTLTSINNTITNITTNFTNAWNEAGVGDSIMETILGMAEDISGFIADIATDTEEWSANLDFYPLLDSINNILGSCRRALDLILTATESLYRNYILKIVEKLTEESIPDLLNSVSEDVDKIVDSLDGFDWDHFFTIMEKLTELGIDNTVSILKDRLSELANVCAFAATEITLVQKAIKKLEEIDESNTMLSKLWNWLKKILDIIQSWSFSWENLFPGGGKVIETINTIQEAWESLKDLFDGGDYEGWGSDIYDGLVEGFTSGDWKEAVKSIWSGFVEALKDVFGIHSPAENVKPYGKYIFEGITTGFTDAFTTIKSTISSLYTKFTSAIKEKFGNFSISNVVSGLGNIALNVTTTLSGAITQFADFTGLSTTLNTIKTKYTNMKAKLTSTLSGAFTKITGEGSTLSTLSTKWKELKESWTDKLATLKANVGGQMSQVSDITTWKSYFNDLKTTWSDKTATLKAQVGGQISTIEDMVGDGASSWKSKFKNFVDKVWNDDTATMKAEATVGGSKDGTLSKLVSGGSWYDRFTGFTKLWGTTYTSTMKATANIGGGTDDSLSNFSDNTGSTWRKKFNDFTALWGKTTTATFDAAYHNADTNSAGYQAYCNLWNNWQDKTATFTVAYNANAQEGLTTMANTVLRKIYDAMDASGIKLKTKVWAARGGIVNYPVYAGEAGQEAIIPLERNLGWMDKMATAISDKITNTKLPDIVTGNILPSTQEFTALMNASTKNIEALLEVIISRLNALESSNHEPIMLQLDSRTVAEVVWDETEKRYKQTGIRYAY